MPAISLEFGSDERWDFDLPSERILHVHRGPAAVPDAAATILDAIQHPLEFPSLELALVPDDRVVIVLDRSIPSSAEIIAAAWSKIELAGVDPVNVLILQPASTNVEILQDPRQLLPERCRHSVAWKIHDPTAADSTGYLASSAGGERIYLSRELLDADFVLPISRLGYDSMLGRRELTSSFYPGLSTPDAFAKVIGQGHSELGPDDERPLRQLIHEVAWLLGIQFAIQVLPSRGHRGPAAVLAGSPDRVAESGRVLLDQNWRVCLDQRGETAVVAIPNCGGPTNWGDLGAALETAHKLVVQGGRIIVLSDLQAEPGPGVDLIRSNRSAKAALQPLRKAAPPDVLTASQIASAASSASIYLYSRLESRLVEELFMTPLESANEAGRLLETCDGCVVLDGAQHVFGEIAS